MAHCGVVSHEEVGATFLEALGYPPVTVGIVRGHVNAKRVRAMASCAPSLTP